VKAKSFLYYWRYERLRQGSTNVHGCCHAATRFTLFVLVIIYAFGLYYSITLSFTPSKSPPPPPPLHVTCQGWLHRSWRIFPAQGQDICRSLLLQWYVCIMDNGVTTPAALDCSRMRGLAVYYRSTAVDYGARCLSLDARWYESCGNKAAFVASWCSSLLYWCVWLTPNEMLVLKPALTSLSPGVVWDTGQLNNRVPVHTDIL
jgi:hypothetical protein